MNVRSRALATPLRRGRWCFWLAPVLLSACASLLPRDAEMVEGRLAVQVQATADQASRSFTAPFTLRGDERTGTLEFSTPLGTMLARASWQPGSAVLISVEGERRFASLDAMAQELFDAALPMGALMAWMRGRPWDGAPHELDVASGRVRQLGWLVDLSRHAEGVLNAERRSPAPAVTVRARLESR